MRQTIDFGFTAMAAVALWALGLAEVAWLPFACLAMASSPGRGTCRRRRRARLEASS